MFYKKPRGSAEGKTGRVWPVFAANGRGAADDIQLNIICIMGRGGVRPGSNRPSSPHVFPPRCRARVEWRGRPAGDLGVEAIVAVEDDQLANSRGCKDRRQDASVFG